MNNTTLSTVEYDSIFHPLPDASSVLIVDPGDYVLFVIATGVADGFATHNGRHIRATSVSQQAHAQEHDDHVVSGWEP